MIQAIQTPESTELMHLYRCIDTANIPNVDTLVSTRRATYGKIYRLYNSIPSGISRLLDATLYLTYCHQIRISEHHRK